VSRAAQLRKDCQEQKARHGLHACRCHGSQMWTVLVMANSMLACQSIRPGCLVTRRINCQLYLG
jgi:hypothetical protein